MIRFRFDEARAADAAGLLIELHGGRMEYIRLVKLLYLADRRALRARASPITGDTYYSMKHGPVVSAIYDLLKEQGTSEPPRRPWTQRVHRVGRYDVEARGEALGALSKEDKGIVRATHDRFERLNTWELVEATHKLPEWKNPGRSCVRIDTDELLRILGITGRRLAATADAVAVGDLMRSLSANR